MGGREGKRKKSRVRYKHTDHDLRSIPRSTITHGVLHLNVRTRYIYEENISKSLVNINRR